MMHTRKSPDHLGTIGRTLSMNDVPLSEMLSYFTSRYPTCYKFTRQYEGGYVNDPDDPGGCTNMGITIGTLRAWRDDPNVTCDDVAALSEPEVGMIYAMNYWSPVWGNDLPNGLNLQVWDWGVNSGPHRSVEHLQRMVGADDDGVMGPNTLQCVEDYIADHGITNVINDYAEDRETYYRQLSTFDKYGDGWLRRNDDCEALAHKLASAADNVHVPVLPTPDDTLEARVAELERWRNS